MKSSQTTTRRVIAAKTASWKQHLGNWRTFAAVGGATLAASTNADAGIVYSGPVNLTVSIPPTMGTHVSEKTFSLGGYHELLVVSKSAMNGNGAQIVPATSKGYLHFARNATNFAQKYAFGNSIHPANTSVGAGIQQHKFGHATRGSFGPGVVTGFVGFRASNGDLGWIQLRVSDTGSSTYPNEVTVIDWAYNDVSGGSIFAGQTTAVPEPSSLALGLLAAGSAGLAALRRAKVRAQGAQ